MTLPLPFSRAKPLRTLAGVTGAEGAALPRSTCVSPLSAQSGARHRGMALRLAALVLGIAALAGCNAVSAVSSASAPLDAYTLSVPQVAAPAARNGLHLVVEVPATTGALATDRILVRPNALQAAYLPGARWIDPAPVMMQGLLVATLQNRGGFRRVGRDAAGLVPDYTLLSDLRAFQVDPAVPGAARQVRIALALTLVREADRSLAAAQIFEATAAAGSDSTLALVAAFDAAARQVLTEGSAWTIRQAR